MIFPPHWRSGQHSSMEEWLAGPEETQRIKSDNILPIYFLKHHKYIYFLPRWRSSQYSGMEKWEGQRIVNNILEISTYRYFLPSTPVVKRSRGQVCSSQLVSVSNYSTIRYGGVSGSEDMRKIFWKYIQDISSAVLQWSSGALLKWSSDAVVNRQVDLEQ